MFTFDLGDSAELRMLQVSDAAEFLEFVQTNRAYLREWLNWVSEVQTLQDAQKFLQECTDDFARDGLPTVGILQDGKMAGGMVFFATNHRLRATEVGYWLGANYTGHGLMTRALSAVLTYVFGTLGFNRVTLSAELLNTRSRRVADRVGFTYEGIKRDGWKHDEQFVDLAVYSMLARDWQSLRENH